MTTREWAARYISWGWYPIPLKPRTKDAFHTDWTERIFTPEDFEDDHNIGIRTVSAADKDRSIKLIAVDLDCPEAVAVASLLPPTKARFGRATKAVSQVFYVCPIEKPINLYDVARPKATVEVRAGKQQSVVPPSIHQDTGEDIRWLDDPIEAAVIEPATLLRRVRMLQTATLILRYYPEEGGRHEVFLAVAGVLRHLGLSLDEAAEIVVAAAQATKNGKPNDRLLELRTTYSRSDDEAVTAGKSLIEHLENGDKLLKSLTKTWGTTTGVPKSVIDGLNEKHAILFQQSGDLILLTEDKDAEGRVTNVRFSKPAIMPLLYTRHVVIGHSKSGDEKLQKLGDAWLNDQRRRNFNGIEIAPNERRTPGYYNLWRGFSTEPKKGDWSWYRRQLREVVADGDEYREAYVLKWMAETVQHPDRPIGIALALRGAQGTGKSTFFKWFGELFGPHFLHLSTEDSLTGRFSGHLQNTIALFADEAVWAGGKAGVGRLKALITEETITIERKHVDTMSVKNLLHIMIASNNDWVVPMGMDDRRFCVLQAAEVHRNDRVFFESVHKQLINGGHAALLYDMLEWNSDVDLRDRPVTRAAVEQAEHSMDPIYAWWYEILQDGGWWREENRREELFTLNRAAIVESFTSSFKGMWTTHGAATKVGRFFEKVLPAGFPRTISTRQSGRAWVVPSLKMCRKSFESIFHGARWDVEETNLFE